jgi:1-deoxy-D-xylulose-5-phosphate reductoisomerase
VFQCLAGENGDIARLILTASGGPFRDTPAEGLERVTVSEALRHPTWQMGAKISIDSATLLNKGLEVIEAHHLFGVGAERIEVLIHPQSVVHSMVEFADGSVKAQMGAPDMRLPIQYALSFPQRWEIQREKFNFVGSGSPLTFQQPDHARFPALGLAYEALRRGGNAGAVLNAANEVAVSAFLDGRIGFTAIPRVIEHTLARAAFVAAPTIDALRESNSEAAEIAHAFI